MEHALFLRHPGRLALEEARAAFEAATPAPGRLELYAALDGSLTLAYWWSDDPALLALRPPGTSARLLRPRLDRAKPSGPAPYHYVVETDSRPEIEEWYEKEHLPGLASVPGCARARQLFYADGPARSHACYSLESPAVLESAEWLAVRHTEWSSRVRPLFSNPLRVMCRIP